MPARVISRGAVALLAATVTLLAAGVAGPPPAWASAGLNGGGSGFAALEIQQWQGDVASPAYGSLSINYSSQSSGIGRQYFGSNTWDFAATDIRYIPGVENALLGQLQSGRCGGRAPAQCFQYVPVSAGGLGFMYNLSKSDGSRFTGLNLTPVDVCRIFTGQLPAPGMVWGNPELVAHNPSLAGSTQPITPVVRQDEAGESYVLSQYCLAEDPADWSSFAHFQQTNFCTTQTDYYSFDGQAFVSGAPVPIWPSVLSGCRGALVSGGSDGVANIVVDPSQGPGSITYNAAGYALVRNFPNASVENAAGRFTEPNAQSVTIALEYARSVQPPDGTFILDFAERSGADPRAYNPSTYSYVLAQTGGFRTSLGTTLGRFLCYAIGIGQKDAAPLLYAPLSKQVQQIGENAVVQIPGAPPRGTSAGQCLAGAPAASNPPPLQVVTPVATTAPGSSGTTAGTPGSMAAGGRAAGSSAGSSSAGSGTAGSSSTGRAARAAAAASGRTGGTAATAAGGSGPASAGNSSLTTGAQGAGTQGGLAAATTPTNYDALWSVLEGAAVCALVVAFFGARRRTDT
jgi:phosphate transport system substrate-binding protein